MSTDRPEGDDREGRHGGDDRDDGRGSEQQADGRGGPELLLREELEDVGEGLHQPERPDAVRAVAALEAPEQLALGDQHDGHELEADGEDHDRLDDLDPPGLVVADEREHHPSPAPSATVASAPSPAAARHAACAASRGRRRDCRFGENSTSGASHTER